MALSSPLLPYQRALTCIVQIEKEEFAMGKKHKLVSLSAIGPHSPGLVSKITTHIFEIGGNIIDLEEYGKVLLLSGGNQ
ncbi:MAG: hypothetical protein R6T98_00175 [Desulfatiglandales bacterium]